MNRGGLEFIAAQHDPVLMAVRARSLMVVLMWIGSPRDRACRHARGRQGRSAPLRRWPEDGPSLSAAVCDGTHCAPVGAEGWCRSSKRMGLPAAASCTLHRAREAEVLEYRATIAVMKKIMVSFLFCFVHHF